MGVGGWGWTTSPLHEDRGLGCGWSHLGGLGGAELWAIDDLGAAWRSSNGVVLILL